MVPEKKLVFTWEWPEMPERESLVTFLLEPIDGGTELTLMHDIFPTKRRAKVTRKAGDAISISYQFSL